MATGVPRTMLVVKAAFIVLLNVLLFLKLFDSEIVLSLCSLLDLVRA
jgi:hypothetical protein